jgi:hypothetical protein
LHFLKQDILCGQKWDIPEKMEKAKTVGKKQPYYFRAFSDLPKTEKS